MKTPPRLATVLLARFGRHNEAGVGDLLEQYAAGRSNAWCWRQSVFLIATSVWGEMRSQASVLVIAGLFASVIALMTYTAFQQFYRRGADKPQVDIAGAAALTMDNGGQLAAIVPQQTVDMTDSLEPFVIVFDHDLRPIASSARLNGRIPVPARGVFDVVSRNAFDHHFTWQPQRGVRDAVVLTHFDGPNGRGFVLVGRSLRVAESKTLLMTRIVMAAWAGSLLGLLAYFGLRRSRTAV